MQPATSPVLSVSSPLLFLFIYFPPFLVPSARDVTEPEERRWRASLPLMTGGVVHRTSSLSPVHTRLALKKILAPDFPSRNHHRRAHTSSRR